MWMVHQYGKLIHEKPCDCLCLHANVVVESLVITLTVVACLAVTGHVLISFDLITVPKASASDHTDASGDGSPVTPKQGNISDFGDNLKEDEHVMDILELVFCYTAIAIAGIFLVEIFAKIITLKRRYIGDPWQVFDAIVVVANAAVQLTFYFVSVSTAVYCASFVVILRLWRVPFVCYMKANQTREQMEQDVELYRSGQRKAEERCARLENALAERNEKIRKLEEGMQTITTNKPYELNGSSRSKLTPVLPIGNFASKENALLQSGLFKKQIMKQGENNMQHENQMNAAIDANRTNIETGVDHFHRNNLQDNENALNRGQNNLLKERYAALGIFSGSLPRSEALYDLKSYTESNSRPNSLPRLQRRRRSSTSDFMDYSTLSSPERHISIPDEVKELSPSYSCPSLDICEENDDTRLESENEPFDMVDRGSKLEKQPSAASGTPSNASSGSSSAAGSSVASDERGGRVHKPIKRFPSCPEYVFTQRMSITTDESLLIEEKHAWAEPLGFNNSAFIDDEDDIPLQVLAEIDGTKTYRSEDGIPMTSL